MQTHTSAARERGEAVVYIEAFFQTGPIELEYNALCSRGLAKRAGISMNAAPLLCLTCAPRSYARLRNANIGAAVRATTQFVYTHLMRLQRSSAQTPTAADALQVSARHSVNSFVRRAYLQQRHIHIHAALGQPNDRSAIPRQLQPVSFVRRCKDIKTAENSSRYKR